MTSENTNPETFRRLVTRGDLEGLNDWIRERRPLREASGKRRRESSALELAVKTGFYSMVKLLLDKTIWSEDEMERSLDTALWNRREDLVFLLLEKGAPVGCLSFHSVFRTMNDSLIERLLELGLDPCHDNAFAQILDETKAKPLLRFFKEKRERFPGLEDQMAMALIEAVRHKNLRWSALLIWAGADLQREAPYDLNSDPQDENCYKTTAQEEAISTGDFNFITALKIKPTPGMLGEMLAHASYHPEKAEFKALLKRITPEELNSGAHGGCDALRSLLTRRYFGYASATHEAEHELIGIDELLKAGAKWLTTLEDLKATRSCLGEHDDRFVVQVIRMLLYTPRATTLELIWELCRTDKLRTKIQSADQPLWDELLEMVIKAGIPTTTNRKSAKNSGSRSYS